MISNRSHFARIVSGDFVGNLLVKAGFEVNKSGGSGSISEAQAVALLRRIRDINVFGKAGNERLGKYLFPVAGSRSDTISENRMLDVMNPQRKQEKTLAWFQSSW